jgi:hypothetical protein
VHDAGVGQLLVDRAGGGGLEELAEARARVGEAPTGDFDVEVVQQLEEWFAVHGATG